MDPINNSKLKKKRGLVLEGGGAKGAYAFGCLLAFKEHGIKFDAVAGTSIGGINAACWATKSLPEGEKLWRSLRPLTLTHSMWFLIFLLAVSFFQPLIGLFILICFLSIIPYSLLSEFFIGRTEYLDEMGLGAILTMIITLLSVVGAYYVAYVLLDSGFWQTVIVCIYTIIFVFGMYTDNAAARHTFMAIVSLSAFLFIIRVIFFLGYLLVAEIYNLFIPQTSPDSIKFPESLPSFFQYGVYAIGALFIFIGYFLISRKISLLNQRNLKSLITKTLTNPFTLPTYICAARKVDVINHKSPSFIFSSQSDGLGTVHLSWISAYIPEYIRLDEISDDEQKANVLLATSALPVGIFPPVRLDGKEYVDGGTVDNLPIYELINSEKVDELIIVRITPQGWTKQEFFSYYGKTRLRTLLEEYTNRLKERFRQMKIPSGDYYGDLLNDNIHDESKQILKDLESEFENSNLMPKRIITIEPSESLGGFLTGTLRFTPKYVNKLIEQGKRDAIKVILSGTI
jgi:predicted acylesterase/phospholipase RssA